MKSLPQEMAAQFLDELLFVSNYNEYISRFDSEYYSLHEEYDQKVFLSIVASTVEEQRKEHEKICTDPVCPSDLGYLKVNSHFQYLMKQLGILQEDQFSSENINTIVEQFDNLIKAYEAMGQEIENLKRELNDLKDHFFLGKKRWRQFSKGKFGEMVASGLVSEAIAKPMVDFFNESISQLGY